jgi:hypothetical protein
MPTFQDLFPYGEGDGNCAGCGCYVSYGHQENHLTWHQEIHTATGVG